MGQKFQERLSAEPRQGNIIFLRHCGHLGEFAVVQVYGYAVLRCWHCYSLAGVTQCNTLFRGLAHSFIMSQMRLPHPSRVFCGRVGSRLIRRQPIRRKTERSPGVKAGTFPQKNLGFVTSDLSFHSHKQSNCPHARTVPISAFIQRECLVPQVRR